MSSHVKCVYHNCGNTSRDVSLFRFPVHDQGRLLLWIRNSGNILLDSLTKDELSRRFICSAHFKPASVHKGQFRSRLLGPAVPIHFKSSECENNPSVGTSTLADMEIDTTSTSPEVLKVRTPTKFYKNKNRTHSSSKLSTPSTHSLGDDFFSMGTPTTRLSRKCMVEEPKKRLSRKCLFQEILNDTNETCRLKQEGSKLLRKNNALRAQLKRLRAKLKVKNRIQSTTQFRSEVSKTLSEMQTRPEGNKKKWSKKEKEFCMSLFYKSPSTYIFLRRQGVVLASPSTIRSWLAKSNCLPGLCPEVFEELKVKFKNATIQEKSCVVCFDEMSIMRSLEYSKKYDLVEGFEDLGRNQRKNALANYVLVFMVRGLYKSWKMPVAYFLSHNNVKAENVILLVKAIINKLFDNGLLPKAIVCDQATTNQKVFKNLGVSNNSPFFFVMAGKYLQYLMCHI